MSEKIITLTDKEKERLKYAYPFLQKGEWNDAFRWIANGEGYGYYTAPLHILSFLKQHGIDLMRKITYIPDLAFWKCTELEEITISSNIKAIGNDAFYYCYNLKSVKIENGVKGIHQLSFNGCKELPAITIPNSVDYIGYGVFQDCSILKHIYFDGTKQEWDNITKEAYWSGIKNFELIFLK